MSLPNESYHFVVVESYLPLSTAGLRGPVHIRPAEGQLFGQVLQVRCPEAMQDSSRYPVGTRFRIKVKLTDNEGSRPFPHAPHQWKYEVQGQLE